MRTCTVCGHPQRAEIDRALLAGTPYRTVIRTVADRRAISKTALIRHRSHIAAAVAEAERATGLQTLHDVLKAMDDLQRRVERLATKLEGGKDHRVTLQAYREAREGLRAISELLTATDLDARLRKLEGGEAHEKSDPENAA